MTTLAIGGSATVQVGDGGYVSVATNGGFGTVVVTQVTGQTVTDSFGPSPYRRTYGPLIEGGTVAITNVSAGQFDYDTVGVSPGLQSLLTGDRNTLAMVGDSFTARARNDVATTYETYPEGYWVWALQLSGRRMTLVSDQSVSGSYVTQGNGAGRDFSVQVANAIASGAKHLLMMGGINDIINSVPNATIKSYFIQHITAAVNAGMKVWWCIQPCLQSSYSGYTVAKQGAMLELNDWIRQQANTSLGRGNVVVIDTASKLMDPASTTGNWLSGTVNADNLHPINAGAYRMGKEVARVWNALIPEAPVLLSSAADQYGYSTACNNILDNGLFLSGSPTGTGFTQSVFAGGACTPSIVARSDGYGNDQQQLCTFAAANDAVVLTTGDLKARVSVGDWIQASCEVTVSALTNYRSCRLNLSCQASISSFIAADSQNATTDSALPEGHTIVLETKPFQITAAMGSLTSLTSSVRFAGSGAGGVTGKIGRWSVRRLTALA